MSLMEFREPNQVLWRGIRPGHNGTQVVKSASVANGAAILHTVNNGVTLFLTAASFSVNSSNTGVLGRLAVRNAADTELYRIFNLLADAIGSWWLSLSFDPPLEIPTGYDVFVESGAATLDARGFIHGWEE